jgi:hypothetical protein
VLFEDEDLIPLPGESRGGAEAAEPGADDDGVIGSGRELVLAASRECAPIPGEEGHAGQDGL